ncbi:MAG: hypothetical protein M3680_14755 [Myxococcota bacterium]|nr:hypothetical protein [Myxococcota bacterium]
MGGFSFASVILSYFLVGGGLFTGTLAANALGIQAEYFAVVVMALGAFIGGFIAARASRGSTIIEPAIGAVAVVATVVAMVASTSLGSLIWAFAQDESIKSVAVMGGASVVGAVLGAALSEKLLGEATTSSIPWVLYTAFATFGTCVLGTLLASILFVQRGTSEAAVNEVGAGLVVGIGSGCLLAGLAIGASARTRPLLASLLGGAIGLAAFFYLITRYASAEAPEQDALIGLGILAGAGAIVTMIGTAIGWAAVGRRHASY